LTPNISEFASDKAFGHLGFTGTCVWVDPEEELIFIFLSNRITPSTKNNKLFKTKLRSRIHSIVYEALGSYQSLSASLAVETSDLPLELTSPTTEKVAQIDEDCEEDIMASRK